MNTQPIESGFAHVGARLKVREIASLWRQGARSGIDPADYALDKRENAEHYHAGRPFRFWKEPNPWKPQFVV